MFGKNFLRAACVALCLCALALSVGCSSSASTQLQINDQSPQFVAAHIETGSSLTEDTQYVQLSLDFDASLEDADDVLSAFNIQLNGEGIDSTVIKTEACVENDQVVITLRPTDKAAASSAAQIFALYEGQLEVSAADTTGGLLGVVAAKSCSGCTDANAVLSETIQCTIPSGVEISAVYSQVGNAAAGTCASVSFDVDQFAQLRCCTWIDLGSSFSAVKVHNHDFSRDTQATCASRIAQTIQSEYDGMLSVYSEGSTVYVTALKAVDGEVLDVSILQGVGVVIDDADVDASADVDAQADTVDTGDGA